MLTSEVRGPMRILAFHFVDGDAADSTVRRLRAHLNGALMDIQTASVVVDDVEGIVLGLTVEREARSAVVALVTSRGGRLVADVPEEWTDRPLT